MVAQKNDLDQIGEVLLGFFKTKRIRDSLEDIHQVGITGWEKWWQTELAMYLSSADTIAEWDMEHPFETDRRSQLSQSRMALDIGFRLKRYAKDEWHFIELKQHNDYKLCIDRMCRDADKVFSARKHSFDGIRVRYIACAGAFLSVKNTAAILEYAEEALDSINAESKHPYLEPISKHHLLLII
ncbi:hypothetical protein ACSVCE_06530 [Chromobacterium haemolyticum]|uniref:hypothetical protein n=1 Tax=Chromobacterium haemolyticum TaxID=394935 RepID=UPI0005934DE8|nr:hypothetical protein [Chromobacterium haemolyticum]MDH0340728.1 hypothetical protein [Chromobacterium haemolyticum]